MSVNRGTHHSVPLHISNLGITRPLPGCPVGCSEHSEENPPIPDPNYRLPPYPGKERSFLSEEDWNRLAEKVVSHRVPLEISNLSIPVPSPGCPVGCSCTTQESE